MSTLAAGGLLGLAVSIVGYLIMAKRDSVRVHTFSSYFFNSWTLDERLVGVTQFSSSMSLATVVIALLQLAGVFGIALSWATLTFCAGWLIFAAAVPRIRAKTTPRDTIHSFIGRSYDSVAVRKTASIATIAGFLGLFATELFAAETVIRALGIPAALTVPLIVIFGAVTVAYASIGGFRSVVRSDWSQTTLLLLAIGTLTYLTYGLWAQVPGRHLAVPPHQSVWISLPLAVAASLFFINVPYPFVDTQAWQRARAASSDSAARWGTAKATLLFAATWTALIIVGVVAAASLPPGTEPFAALLAAGTRLSAPVAFAIGLVLVPGLFAAMFSSADAFINSATHVFSLDLTGVGQSADAADVTTIARRHALVLGLLGLVICISLRALGFGIVDMVFAVSAGQIALLPSVALALTRYAGPAYKPAAIISIVTGFGLAWLNGLYATIDPSWTATLLPTFHERLPPDVYRSPIYAFIGSVVAFAVTAVMTRAPQRTRRAAS